MSIEGKLHGTLKGIGVGKIRQKGGYPLSGAEFDRAKEDLLKEEKASRRADASAVGGVEDVAEGAVAETVEGAVSGVEDVAGTVEGAAKAAESAVSGVEDVAKGAVDGVEGAADLVAGAAGDVGKDVKNAAVEVTNALESVADGGDNKNFKMKFKHYVYLFFFVILVLVPLIWFKDDFTWPLLVRIYDFVKYIFVPKKDEDFDLIFIMTNWIFPIYLLINFKFLNKKNIKKNGID